MGIFHKGFAFVLVVTMLMSLWVGNSEHTEQSNKIPKISPEEELQLSIGSFFILNKGQIPDPEVKFHSKNAYFTSSGVIFRVFEDSTKQQKDFQNPMVTINQPKKMHIYKMEFLGANHVVPVGKGLMQHYYNFFLGNDPRNWASHIPNYNEIVYENLYDNIDLCYRMVPQGIKYEFIIFPGGDVKNIRMRYEGAAVSTDGSNIYLKTSVGTVVDGGFYVYQELNNNKVPVKSRIKCDNNIIQYDIQYNPKFILVIDPLIYSTYIGDTESDYGEDLALDSSNNAYATGSTDSYNFPTTVGAYDRLKASSTDAFVLKMNAQGNGLIFSTFIGGGSGETGNGIVLDSSNRVYVTGLTGSDDFPTTSGVINFTHNGGIDAFVLKLNSAGSNLIYSTYMGGVFSDIGYSIALDSANNTYVTGTTESPNFPTTPGAFNRTFQGGDIDIFVLKLNFNASLLEYSTFIPGDNTDWAGTIEIDASNNAYITGYTESRNFPNTTGAYDNGHNGGWDMFVTKINNDGSDLIYSTFIGGRDGENAFSLTLDSSNNVYATGWTYSDNFPTTTNAYNENINGNIDAFVLKLNPSGNALVYSTYIGGSQGDYGEAIALDESYNTYITGWTWSSDYPITQGADDKSYNLERDVFFSILNSSGDILKYSSYLGGSDDETGHAISLDSSNNVYILGETASTDFPTTIGAFDMSFGGGWFDVFISKLAIPTIPGPPANLKLEPGDDVVKLTWDEPVFDGYKPIHSYFIYRGYSEFNLNHIATMPGSLKYYFDYSVADGSEYYYAVSANNSVGEGNLSNVLNTTPGAPPVAPQNLALTAGDGYIDLNWYPPWNVNGFPVINYTIYRAAEDQTISILTKIGATTYYRDNDVKNGKTYSYSVSAHNIRGEGESTDLVSSTPGRPPTVPRNLKVKSGDSYVYLTWEPPEHEGWVKVTNYMIYRSNNKNDIIMFKKVGDVQVYNDTSVENGKVYYYRVSALNSVGESPRTDPETGHPGTLPAAPTLSGISGDEQVDLYWEHFDESNHEVLYFNIYKYTIHSTINIIFNTTNTNYTDFDVINGVTYYYRVTAVNIIGESKISNLVSVTPRGVPSEISNLTAKTGDRYVLLEWEAPISSGGLPVKEYKIFRGESVAGVTFLTNNYGLYYNDTNVKNGATYYYTIAATNNIGQGPKCKPVNATPLGKPGYVKNLILNAMDGKIVLTWQPPEYNGGTPIISYKVYRGESEDELSLLIETPDTSYTDTSVTNGIVYFYKIVAVNKIGDGEVLEIPSIMPGGLPGVPTNFKLEVKKGNAILTWSPPVLTGGFPIERYKIYRRSGEFEFIEMTSVKITTYTDSSVALGKEYFYKISALNIVGEGNTTEELSITITKEPEDTLRGLGSNIFALIAIIIIIIICIIIFLIYLKRKRQKSLTQPPEPMEQPQQPETQKSPEYRTPESQYRPSDRGPEYEYSPHGEIPYHEQPPTTPGYRPPPPVPKIPTYQTTPGPPGYHRPPPRAPPKYETRYPEYQSRYNPSNQYSRWGDDDY